MIMVVETDMFCGMHSNIMYQIARHNQLYGSVPGVPSHRHRLTLPGIHSVHCDHMCPGVMPLVPGGLS